MKTLTRVRRKIQKPTTFRPATLADLERMVLFRDVNEIPLRQIFDRARICILESGQALSPIGDFCYLIVSGYVATWTTSRFDVAQKTFLGWRGPDQLIEDLRPIGAEPSLNRIYACDRCELIEIGTDTLQWLAGSDPAVYRNLLGLAYKTMESERHRSEVIQIPSSNVRIARTLMYLAEERCDLSQVKSAEIRIPGNLLQEELAAYAAVQRQTANRCLVYLRNQSIISYQGSGQGSELVILDAIRLGELASGSRDFITSKRRNLRSLA